MKRLLIFTLKWCLPSVIAFTFLILPDLIKNGHEDTSPPNWIVRIFFTVFLSNIFIGSAKVFNNPMVIKEKLYKYRNTDRDSLTFSMFLGSLIPALGTTIFFFYGLTSFYPFIGWWKYLFTIIYGIIVGTLNYTIHKMQMRQLKDNDALAGNR